VARLDRLIQTMQEQGAKGLQLAAGRPATMLLGGASRAVTKDPLSGAQIVALLREIAPPSIQGSIVEGAALVFPYASPSGQIQVEVDVFDGSFQATLRPERVSPSVPQPVDQGLTTTEIEDLLRRTTEMGASDLHLRTGEPPLFRKDGELIRSEGPPLEAEAIDRMLRSIMAPRELVAYTETGDADWAHELIGVSRFRCNAARERKGPLGVFRVIRSEIVTVDQLGLGAEIQKLCYLPKGLVLVTGPTGSGKSTTLAALIDLINRTRADHIITIEDPVEFVHPSKKCLVTQRQVGLHTRGFKEALRAALREDPDIVMVGELRDLETVSIAIETAETGHLVFGTLHTSTAASTIDRIIDQFPTDRQPQVRVALSESLRGVIAQVLCKKKGGGRVAAHEVLLSIPAISNLIREGKTFQIPSIMQTNRKMGMVTLNDALLELVESGQIEPKEAWSKAVEKIALATALKAKRHDTSFLNEG
jgi:twitching motility protein PilT